MEQGIVPVPIPVLKEDTIELIVHARVRRTQVDRHDLAAVVVHEEAMDASCLDRDLAILGRHPTQLAVDLDAHDARLDLEVLGLVAVEVQWRAIGAIRAVNEFP